MKKQIIGVMIFSFLFVFASASVTFADLPEIISIEKTVHIKTSEKSSAKFLWKAEKASQITDYQGKKYLFVEEKGEGNFNNTYQTWLARSYFFREGSKTIPYQVKITYRNNEGKVFNTVDKLYDRDHKKIYCNIGGKYKVFNFKNNMVDKELLGLLLSNYNFAAKKDLVFNLLTHEPTMYSITIKYRGIEKISIDGKEHECYKLEMIPDLGALNILGAFVPKTYFWYETSAPHNFIRYEGLESGLGTPYVVTDKVSAKE